MSDNTELRLNDIVKIVKKDANFGLLGKITYQRPNWRKADFWVQFGSIYDEDKWFADYKREDLEFHSRTEIPHAR